MRILFVTWDGPQVNYLESLFLPIFKRLEDHNVFFDILQFRWGDPSLAATIERQCSSLGIGYRAQFIHRKPPVIGPFASAFLGARWVREAVKVGEPWYDLTSSPSHDPALRQLPPCWLWLCPERPAARARATRR